MADGRLLGQHYGIRPVEDGIGDVRGFGTCGQGRVNHRFQHLRGHDHRLAYVVAFENELLLYNGDFLYGYLHAQVAPGNHHAIRCLQYRVKIIQRFSALDLGNNLGRGVIFLQEFLHVNNICGLLDKGQPYKVDPMLDCEIQALPVFFSYRIDVPGYAGNSHALVVEQPAACDDPASHVTVGDGYDFQFHQAIIQEYLLAELYMVRQLGQVNRYLVFISQDIARGQDELCAFF